MDNKKWKEITALFGCFIANMVSGTINLWGAVGIYFTSYYHAKDSAITESDMYLAFAVAYALESLFFIIASYLSEIIGPKLTSLIGVWAASIFLFSSSFIEDPYVFCVLYGFYGGIISGMIDVPIIWACWEFFPDKIGRVTSIGFAGYSLGPMAFGFIWTMLVNPGNDSPHSSHNGNTSTSYFGSNVYNKVPASLRWMSLMLFLIATIGTLLVRSKTKERKKVKSTQKISSVIQHKEFWLMFFNFYFLFAPYSFIFTNYKSIGLTKIKNDHFFAYLGSAGFFSACIARLIWGYLVDKYGWRKIALFSCIIQTLVCASIYYVIEIEALYAIWVLIEFIFGSGTYLILMMGCSALYPKDDWVVSFCGIGMTLIVATLYGIQLSITPIIGYGFTFIILVICVITSFILTYFTPNSAPNEKQDVSLISLTNEN